MNIGAMYDNLRILRAADMYEVDGVTYFPDSQFIYI
jgi:hypothetical protein